MAHLIGTSGIREREARRQVFLRAKMRADGRPTDICVRNISARGMLLQAANPPPRGTYIEVHLARHMIVARVVWTKERRFGVQTREAMNIDAIAGMNSGWASPKRLDAAAQPMGKRYVSKADDICRRLERNRRISAALEFSVIMVSSLTAAAIAATILYEQLQSTFETVALYL
ncbi:PilZ domain-containing protein [Rhizorhapis suberifaciens]|uniref:PilZ domain-containing protein n=1 Tax=Rhizorhapis suberifaciens TaxID=13656 RepID=A0A840HSV1_9SPHN|nr:PilZ domain-containing protein [Rhizorhapis suberifaciens]MBB4640660.1 hypothetical protein [Rhizorhapis suberifaciens]